jgi:hypothetical protein
MSIFLNNQIGGKFTSAGTAVILNIPCDLDHIEVLNATQMATTQATGRGVKFEYYRGMANDTGVKYGKEDTLSTLNGTTLASGGFTIVNTSEDLVGPLVTASGANSVTNAAPPVVTAATTGLVDGDVVRIFGTTGALQIAGMDFTIGSVSGTDFELAYMGAPGSAASAVSYRKVLYDPIYYPARLFITNITKAAQAVVTLSVTHNLTVGQVVRMHVTANFGMVEMEGLEGRIVAINTTTNTITLDIDSTGFTTFAFPTSAVAAAGITFPHVVPFGDLPLTLANLLANQSVLDGATRNVAIRGVRLAAGVNSPAGSENDVIYWQATKFNQYTL